MMNNPYKRAFIIGGGASIRNGLWDIEIKNLPIWKVLKNQYTIVTNFAYKWFTGTIHSFVDYHFYMCLKNDLDNLPLIIGNQDPHIGIKKNDNGSLLCKPGRNLYLLPPSKHEKINDKKVKYHGIKSWEKGFYTPALVGLFSLTFAIACGFKEIYLLGYDGKEIDGRTHFYQGDKDRTGYLMKHGKIKTGVGKYKCGDKYIYHTSQYNNEKSLNNYFEPYKDELSRIKIFNVSPLSKIKVFPKIDYTELYSILEKEPKLVLQSRARYWTENLIRKNLLCQD